MWKVAGTLGGEDYPDKVRGPYNEGGLWVERSGMYYPQSLCVHCDSSDAVRRIPRCYLTRIRGLKLEGWFSVDWYF